MSFNPNVSDTTSNITNWRRQSAGPEETARGIKQLSSSKHSSVEKQTQSKLYQKYRKLFEYEKKEKEKLRKQVAH